MSRMAQQLSRDTLATAIAALEFMLSNRRVVRPLREEVAAIDAAIAELKLQQADSSAPYPYGTGLTGSPPPVAMPDDVVLTTIEGLLTSAIVGTESTIRTRNYHKLRKFSTTEEEWLERYRAALA